MAIFSGFAKLFSSEAETLVYLTFILRHVIAVFDMVFVKAAALFRMDNILIHLRSSTHIFLKDYQNLKMFRHEAV